MQQTTDSCPEISVVVATLNRPMLLKLALESLSAQTLRPGRYEVIVVNNGQRGLSELPPGWLDANPGFHVYCEERIPGLSRARNLGLSRARAPIVGFLDDDAMAASDWLERVLQLFSKLKGDVDCVGGPVRPIYDDLKPEWFRDEWETFHWGDHDRYLRERESFVGSNMFWKRSCLLSAGGFPEELGMRGSRLGLGEDTALFDRVASVLARRRFYYCSTLWVLHRVAPEKLSVSYRWRREFVTGASCAIIWKALPPAARLSLFVGAFLRRVYWFHWELVKICRHRHPQSYLVSTFGNLFYLAGLCWGSLGGEPVI